MLPILRVVDERAEMHAVVLRQVAEEVPGADLVPLGRRVGDAVVEEEDLGHGWTTSLWRSCRSGCRGRGCRSSAGIASEAAVAGATRRFLPRARGCGRGGRGRG